MTRAEQFKRDLGNLVKLYEILLEQDDAGDLELEMSIALAKHLGRRCAIGAEGNQVWLDNILSGMVGVVCSVADETDVTAQIH